MTTGGVGRGGNGSGSGVSAGLAFVRVMGMFPITRCPSFAALSFDPGPAGPTGPTGVVGIIAGVASPVSAPAAGEFDPVAPTGLGEAFGCGPLFVTTESFLHAALDSAASSAMMARQSVKDFECVFVLLSIFESTFYSRIF